MPAWLDWKGHGGGFEGGDGDVMVYARMDVRGSEGNVMDMWQNDVRGSAWLCCAGFRAVYSTQSTNQMPWA